MKDLLKVFVVDDHRMFTDALEVLLESEKDVVLVGRTATGEEALETLRDDCPDVLLMDVDLPGMDGIEATRRVKEMCPSTNVVVITAFQTRETIARAIEAGASGYIPKTRAADELVEVIKLAASGETIMPAEEIAPVLARLQDGRQVRTDEEMRLTQLTSREVEILQCFAEGNSVKEVARLLYISPGTVQTHTKNILAKLGVHSKLEAVTLALRHDVIRLERGA
jgi:NarL family two-component system response regulator LiaR